MFQNARNVLIDGGEFNQYQGSYVSNQVNYHMHPENNERRREEAMRRLFEHIAPGAYDNSEDRRDAPKCHPRTRQAVLKAIVNWARNPANLKLLMWPYGPAGSGKSAIMQTICELCEGAGITLGASFFFFRTGEKRNTSKHLIATLAYQLACTAPHFDDHITRAILRDPSVFTRNLASQMKALIIDPMAAAADQDPNWSQWIYLIVVDGLDECSPEESQGEIITLLSNLASYPSPFRVLIASRPELVIRNSFAQPAIQTQTETLALHHYYGQNEDIRLFLHEKFREIRATHLLGRKIPDTWPSEEDMSTLVRNASGHFIYPATVIRYVQSPRHNPVAHLNTVLLAQSSAGQSDKPFAQLDALYHQILSAVADIAKVLCILRYLIHIIPLGHYLRDIEEILGYSSDEGHVLLCDMHSLLSIGEENGLGYVPVRLHHSSLGDFLLDPQRSRHLYSDPKVSIEFLLISLVNYYKTLAPPLSSHNFWHIFDEILSKCSLTQEIANSLSHFNICQNIDISDFHMHRNHTHYWQILWARMHNATTILATLDKYYKWLHREIPKYDYSVELQLYNSAVNDLDMCLSNILHQGTWDHRNFLIALICASRRSMEDQESFLSSYTIYVYDWIDSKEAGFMHVLQMLTSDHNRKTCKMLETMHTMNSGVDTLIRYCLEIPPWDIFDTAINSYIHNWITQVTAILSKSDSKPELGEILQKIQIKDGLSSNLIYAEIVGIPYHDICSVSQDPTHKCAQDYIVLCEPYRRRNGLLYLKKDLHHLSVAALDYLQRCDIVVEKHGYDPNHLICFLCQSTKEFAEDDDFGKFMRFED